MAQLMRLLLLMAIFSIPVVVSAQVACRSAASGAVIVQLLDQAGMLEESLLQVLAETKSQSTAREASQKLVVLNRYIEALFNPQNPISLIEIHEGLKRLAVFREEIPRAPETAVRKQNPYLLRVVMHKRADKDFADLPHYIRGKFMEFVNEASSQVSINFLAPKWSLERVDVREITSDPSYSVRLNRGYRVFFTITSDPSLPGSDKILTVLRISMKVTHE